MKTVAGKNKYKTTSLISWMRSDKTAQRPKAFVYILDVCGSAFEIFCEKWWNCRVFYQQRPNGSGSPEQEHEKAL